MYPQSTGVLPSPVAFLSWHSGLSSMQATARNSVTTVSILLHKTFELSSSLDQDRDACLRLCELLCEISTELKRCRGLQALNRDVITHKRFRKILYKYINVLEWYRRPDGFFRIRRRKTMIQALSPIWKRVMKLLASSSIDSKSSWIVQCENHLGLIRTELEIQRLVALLRSGSEKQKAQAARSLATLAVEESNRLIISHAGGIPPLVALLRGTEDQMVWAATTLANITIKNEANCLEIAEAGAIPLLITRLEFGSEREKGSAVFSLVNLTANEANNTTITQLNGIRLLISMLNGSNNLKRYAIQCLGNLAAKNSTRRTQIVQAGAIPLVCKLALCGTDKEKIESALTLQNMSLGSSDTCKVIAEYGGIKALVAMMKYVGKQQTVAIKALGVFGSNEACCAQIVKRGAIALLRKLESTGNDEQKTVAKRCLQKLNWSVGLC